MKKWYPYSISLIILFILMPFLQAAAQDRCGIIEYTETLRNKNLLHEDNATFEQWLNKRVSSRALRTNEASTSYKIPVVVHVIHKGEAVGTGVNISDAQIRSQIAVLNKDYQRLNADTTNTPDEFKSIAGKVNIEFILAKQDPDGEATTGIVRVKGSRNTWGTNNDAALKATSYWPAEDYLNIWVTDLSSSLLGYAQFPISDLAGMEDAEDNRLTDGVVIDYLAFGSADDGSFTVYSSYNKGRTTTHEVGHYLGLRHIWGDDDGSCGGSGDYVADTPDQGDYTTGCPSNPQTSCSVHTMFQNYMDYTNDACLNLFTKGQVTRMITVLDESPRRSTLSTSHGLDDPNPVANDLGVASFSSPTALTCDGVVTPALSVTNQGTNTVTTAQIQLLVDGTIAETKTVAFSPALAVETTTQVLFSTQTLASGTHTFSAQIIKTNSVDDGKAADNTVSTTTLVPAVVTLPYKEPFNSISSAWTITNADQSTTWALITAPNESTSNKAAFLNFYNYTSSGQEDVLTSPVFDLTGTTAPRLLFDVAYARRSNSTDGLTVYIITDCEAVSAGTQVYAKSGSTLATTASTTTSFTPSGAGDWRREMIDLSAFTGYDHVQVAFVSSNSSGNNLYLDNVTVVSEVTENIALKQVSKPTPVHCASDAQPALLVENVGSTAITSVKVKYTINEGTAQVTSFSGLSLTTGEQTTLTLPAVTLPDGENTFVFELVQPNELADVDNSDNGITYKTITSTAADVIPLRENFNDNTFAGQWSLINPLDGTNWETISTNYEQSVYFKAYSDTLMGDEAWLVSPVLNLSNTAVASVFFDLSYGMNELANNKDSSYDELKIFASRDCGNTFEEVIFSRTEEDMSSAQTSSAWLPAESTQWTHEYVNLNTLAGEEQVRLAFILKNGNGNNLYLDNIEFFLSDDPNPYSSHDLYTIYGTSPESPNDFYITFNLDTRQNITYELVDMMGRQLITQELDDVLNQTYEVDASSIGSGVYIVRMNINQKYYASKVYVGH